ncbi:MAG: glycosyltransferase family 2 protein [Ginsengibacter sp.]
MVFLTVIIPTYNEEKYISLCIESIIKQDFPNNRIEVFFIDGNSTDRTRKIISDYAKRYSYISLLLNPAKYVPFAMNIGIRKAKGDYIIRLDAHADYPETYFSDLIKNADELKADNVGGIQKTEVLNKKKKAIAIKEVLMNRFGVGNSYFRIGSDKILEVDTVPFGCYNRQVFNRVGLYDERLVRNQDIELNKRLKKAGGKIYLIPSINYTYYARENFKALYGNNFSNGYWNILTVYYTRNMTSLSLRHFIPLLFVLSIILPFVGAFFYLPVVYLSALSLILYLIFFISLSAKISFTKKVHFGYLFFAFLVLHFSYGLGSINCLIKLPFLKRV